MKLFRLEYKPAEGKHCPYNTTVLFVGIVRAKDEDSARKVMSDNCQDEGHDVWFDCDLVSCEEVLIDGEKEAISLEISYGC